MTTNDAMYHTYRSDLSEVRALVFERAREAGLAEGRASDLVLAVSEVAANTLRHTGSSGTLAIWHDEREIVCEIRDEGTITDPLVYQVGPSRPARPAGTRAVALVYQVCDFVELNSDASGDDHQDAHGPACCRMAGAERHLAPLFMWYNTGVDSVSRHLSRRSSRTVSLTRWWSSAERPT